MTKEEFTEIKKDDWGQNVPDGLTEIFENNRFLVQVFECKESTRLTVNLKNYTLNHKGKPIWEQGITWDELQEIKDSIGYRDSWFVELYPPQDCIVNVANMRHLWLIDKPSYGWNKEK